MPKRLRAGRLDPESSVFESGFLLEFTQCLIRGANDNSLVIVTALLREHTMAVEQRGLMGEMRL